MKVKMLKLMAGPEGVAQIGSVVEVSVQHGKLLVDGGYAEAVKAPSPQPSPSKGEGVKQRETATKRGSEKATQPKAEPKKAPPKAEKTEEPADADENAEPPKKED